MSNVSPKRLGSAEYDARRKAVFFRLARAADPTRKRHNLRDHLPAASISSDAIIAKRQAEEIAHLMSEEILAGHLRPVRAGSVEETVDAWFDRWCQWRVAQHYVETDIDDRSLYSNHIKPLIGHMRVRAVSTEDIRAIVRRLDRLICEKKDSFARVEASRGKGLSGKRAANAWSTLRSMFRDMHESKNEALRIRPDDPTRDVQPPDRTDKRKGTILYPDEYLRVMVAPGMWEASGEGKMRIGMLSRRRATQRWMRMISIAVYLCMRANEIRALEWQGIDLEHRVISIHQAAKRKSRGKKIKVPKKSSMRVFEIPDEIVPLLEAMRAEAAAEQGVEHPVGRVIELPPEEELALYFRETILRVAGLTREALFADDQLRRPITFHDLRATGITWRIMRGDNHTLVQATAGHKSFAATEDYINAASLRGKSVGQPFPPIPAIVLGGSERRPFAATDSVAGNRSETAQPGGADGTDPACPAAVPQPSRKPCNHLESASKIATPTGIENGNSSKNPAKTGHFRSSVPQDAVGRAPLPSAWRDTDAVATALRVALENAIADGRSTDAAELASELAARARSVKSPNVVPLASRRPPR
jgi:integrase